MSDDAVLDVDLDRMGHGSTRIKRFFCMGRVLGRKREVEYAAHDLYRKTV